MRETLLSFVLLIVVTCSYSQQSKDSIKSKSYYQKIIDSSKNRDLVINALGKMIGKAENSKEYIDYIDNYIDYALANEYYAKAIGLTVNSFYYVNTVYNNTEKAMSFISKVEPYSNKTDDTYLLGNLYLKKAGGYLALNNQKKAIENYSLAIKKFGSKDSIYIADAIFFRGQSNFYSGNLLEAINDYQLASIYYENLNDIDYSLYTMLGISHIYGEMGFYDEAIKVNKEIIEKRIKEGNLGITGDYYTLSITYDKVNNSELRKESLLNALNNHPREKEKILDNNATEVDITFLYSSLSEYYSDYNLKLSKKYLDSVKYIATKKALSPTATNFYNSSLSYYYLKSNNFNNALKYANEIDLNLIKGDVFQRIDHEELLSNIYEKKGDQRNALIHFRNYTKLRDSILSVQKTNALSYYQTLYDTERKENEIASQERDIAILDAKNDAKTRLLIFGSIFMVLTFSLIMLYRNRRRVKKEKRLQEEYSQQLLITQENERKRISKDLHDSLGQTLLLIKNSIIQKKSENNEHLVNSAIEEMRTISKVLHPYQLEEIGLSKSLENLIEQLDESYANSYIFGEIEQVDNSLTISQQLNVFRIVQECLSNALKHAKATSTKVNLQYQGDQLQLKIQDNGIGFNFQEKYQNFKTLGLKTIHERVKYLKGTLNIDSKPNLGTTFIIQFPIA